MSLGCPSCGSLQTNIHFSGCNPPKFEHREYGLGFGLARLKSEGEPVGFDDRGALQCLMDTVEEQRYTFKANDWRAVYGRSAA